MTRADREQIAARAAEPRNNFAQQELNLGEKG